MMLINIFVLVLVVVGILLTTNTLSSRINFGKTIGWAMMALGMLILSVCGFASGKIIFASVSLVFAIVDAYFSIEYFDEG